MMNLVALCLVFSTIFSGGIFNPSTQQDKKNNHHPQHREDLIIKEANRVIMVEYERETRPNEDTNNYSPPSQQQQEPEPSVLDQKLSIERSMASGVKNKLKEASTVLPNIGQGVSYSSPSGEGGGGGGYHYNAREIICDAYGKCKHKIAGVFGKSKDGAAEKVNDAVEKMGKAKDAGEDAVEKAKERVFEKVREMEEAMEKAGEKAKDGVGRVKEQGQNTGEMVMKKTKDGLGKVKEQGKETGEMAMEKTKEGLERAKDKVYETGEMAKEGFSKVKEQGKETGENAKEGLSKIKEQGKETGEIAMEKSKEGLGKAKSSVSEKAQELKQKAKETGQKTVENVVNVGYDLKKGHNSIGDDRTINEKWTGLFNEGIRNFSDIFHRGSKAFVDAAKHSVSKEVMNPTMGVLHLLGLATAYGISVWVTFVSSYVLAGALPRQQFGIVQSEIYPVYFGALVGSIGAALLAHVFRNPYWGFNSLQTYNMFASLGLVLLNLLYFEPPASKVMFDKMKLEKEEGRGVALEGEEFVEAAATIPTAITTTGSTATTTTTGDTTTDTTETSTGVTAAPSARREDENDEVRNRVGELNRRLKNLNSVSSLLNVLTLMALTWQLVYLGRGLPVS
ncbi:hypothetical protein ACHQM5_022522 [Ranunculus cassubicifolius]